MEPQNRLKDFLELTYNELEKINTQARSLGDPLKAKTTHITLNKRKISSKLTTVTSAMVVTV